MRKIAFILFCWLCLCVPAYAANFVEIHKDPSGQTYIDVDSIASRKSGNHEYLVAWVKYIPSGDWSEELYDEYGVEVDHILEFQAYNKDMRQILTLSEHTYDKSGNIVEEESWLFEISDYEEVIPDTYGELTYDFAIKYRSKNKK